MGGVDAERQHADAGARDAQAGQVGHFVLVGRDDQVGAPGHGALQPVTGTGLGRRVLGATAGATTILISVLYRNINGSKADRVSAKVGAADLTMNRVKGGAWGQSVKFIWTGKLPAGTNTVVINAIAHDDSQATLTAGTVVILEPGESHTA